MYHRYHRRRSGPPRYPDYRVITARRDDTCRQCKGAIAAGDEIAWATGCTGPLCRGCWDTWTAEVREEESLCSGY